MKNRLRFRCKLLTFCLASGLLLQQNIVIAQNARITVNAQNVVNRVSPWLAGSCIEDVNHEIYGGLYDQKIFGESFEEPPLRLGFEGWQAFGGDWRLSDQVVTVGANSGAKLVSGSPDFSDGTVTGEIKFSAGNSENAGLLVRVSNPGTGADNFDGYEISLNPRTQRLILGKHRHDYRLLQDVAASFEPREWTRMRVELRGARIQVFVGESATPLIDFTDAAAPFLSGTFALRTWNSDAAFRNLRGPNSPLNGERLVEKPAIQVSGQWDAVRGGGASAQFLHDSINPYNGAWSQMIHCQTSRGSVGVANRGLNRWGIAAKRSQALGGRIYLRAHDLQGPVTLALQSADGSKTYARQIIGKVAEEWKKYPISLSPNADDANARFVVTLDKPGTLWMDQATLTGTGDAQFKGLPIRADIGRMMQQQGIRFLRYGGTMVNAPEYRWKKMIGDPDKRLPYRGHWYAHSSNGFGIEEFLQFCEAAGIEPAFAINVEETEQDIADLVEYLNGDATTLWGRRRAQNGHPKPYGVRWIQLGNEEVIWEDSAKDYEHYAARFNALHDVIHAKDPKIQTVCAAWWRPDSLLNMERVFKAIEGKAAFWDLHVWSDEARAGATVDRDLTQMESLFKKWAPATKMKCVIFEENGNLHSQQRALGHATTLNAVRRHGDFVVVSCPANALQPDGQNDNGWDQGQIFFTPTQVWGMPPFYAAQMAARNHQPLRVGSAVENNLPESELDVTATRSDDGKSLVLHVVNTGRTPQPTSILIEGMPLLAQSAKKWTLAGEMRQVNSPNDASVKAVESQFSIAGPRFETTFPASSYTILRFERKGA